MKLVNTIKNLIVTFVSVALILNFSAFQGFFVLQKNNTAISASAQSSIDELAEEVTILLNEYREKNGLSALKTVPLLQKNAMTRAEELSVSFSHNRPNGTSCFTAIDDSLKKSSLSWAENVAYGQKTPEEVVNQWANSEAHRENMLNSKFTHIGIGVYYKNGVYYWSQLFLQSYTSFSGEYTAGVYSGSATLSDGTGDVNLDGAIDSRDAVVVLHTYATTLIGGRSSIDTAVADVNSDGMVDARDAVNILCYYAKLLLETR